MNTDNTLDLSAIYQEIAGYFDIKTMNARAYAALNEIMAEIRRLRAQVPPLAPQSNVGTPTKKQQAQAAGCTIYRYDKDIPERCYSMLQYSDGEYSHIERKTDDEAWEDFNALLVTAEVQEPHIPSGYMEETICRKCGRPKDDPIHMWIGGAPALAPIPAPRFSEKDFAELEKDKCMECGGLVPSQEDKS